MSVQRGASIAKRAHKLYRGKGFRHAYMRGALAAVAGRPLDACPYPAKRDKTWGTAYRRAWLRGYESESQ